MKEVENDVTLSAPQVSLMDNSTDSYEAFKCFFSRPCCLDDLHIKDLV